MNRLTLFGAITGHCDMYAITGQSRSRLAVCDILHLIKSPQAVEVPGGVVIAGANPTVLIFASLNAGGDELENLPGRAREMLAQARRLSLITQIREHRAELKRLEAELEDL